MESGEPAGGTEEVEAALRRLMSAEREFDTTSEALAARSSQPARSVSEQAVRTIESVHRLVMEIEDAAHARAAAIEREAQDRAGALIAEAEAERERMWSELRELIGNATSEVERLHGVRDRLREDISRVLGESRETLERLAEDARRARSAPAPAPPDFAQEPRVAEVQEPRAAEPSEPRVEEPGQAPEREAVAAALVRLELDAGPFPAFADVLAFESELATRDEVASVYVSRFTGGRVRASVGAVERESLVRAIRELPSVSSVEETGGTLSVTIDGSR